jgi:hypothetical protein
MSGGGGGEYGDQKRLLNSANSTNYDEENELEAQDGRSSSLNRGTSSSRGSGGGGGGLRDLLKRLDRGFSGRRHSFKRSEIRDNSRNTIVDNHHQLNHLNASDANDVLGDSAPPEWALLLLGCILGLATGLFVAAFNKGVCSFLLLDLVLHIHLHSFMLSSISCPKPIHLFEFECDRFYIVCY